MVRDLDVRILPQFEGRFDFEGGLEAQRLAIMEMDVADVGTSHQRQAFGLDALLEMLGNQAFQHLLPDIPGEGLANQG